MRATPPQPGCIWIWSSIPARRDLTQTHHRPHQGSRDCQRKCAYLARMHMDAGALGYSLQTLPPRAAAPPSRRRRRRGPLNHAAQRAAPRAPCVRGAQHSTRATSTPAASVLATEHFLDSISSSDLSLIMMTTRNMASTARRTGECTRPERRDQPVASPLRSRAMAIHHDEGHWSHGSQYLAWLPVPRSSQ